MKKTISWINRLISFCALTLFFCLFAFSTQAAAADFTVNLTTDEHDAVLTDGVCDTDLATAGEQCSLRAAVEQANALPGNDRILFSLPSDSTIMLTMANGGEMSIEDALEIVGTGADNLTINGGGSFNRIFFTLNSAVTISGVTLTGGNGIGLGGAIFTTDGSLTLDGVHVKSNSTSGSGGGVVFFSGAHRIVNSTFSANNAGDCGGFFNLGGTVSIANSTISGNTAANFGGGFCTTTGIEPTTLRNVTMTGNTAGSGGGIYAAGLLNLGNTIVAGNSSTNNTGPEILFDGGEVTSAGGNLIGDSMGDSGNTGTPVLYQSSDILDANPLLGNLTDNGGKTRTHALLANSPAIDKGLDALATDLSNMNAPLAFDQRGTGFPRLSGTFVDIGAFEVQQAPVVTPSTPEEMIEDLKELIKSYNPRLHHGIEKSLLAKLNSALAALAEENTAEARGSLQAFIYHVRAQKGKKITAARAEELTEAAEEILEALE